MSRTRIRQWKGGLHRFAAVALACLLLSVGTPEPLAASSRTTQKKIQELKAAFTYKFIPFVTWPDAPEAAAGFNLCLLGKKGDGSAFDALVGRETATGKVQITHIDENSLQESCAIIFFAGPMTPAMQHMLDGLSMRPVLTVGESEDFAKAGGMIALIPARHKLGFEINLTVARSAGLQMSSKLLNLAEHVY